MSIRNQITKEREKRKALLDKARQMLALAENEKRDLNEAEDTGIGKLRADIESLDARIANLEAMLESEESDEAEREGDSDQGGDSEDDSNDKVEKKGKGGSVETGEDGIVILGNGQRAKLLKSGEQAKRNVQPQRAGKETRRRGESKSDFEDRCRRNKPEYREVAIEYLINGERALKRGIEARTVQADVDIVGGYMVLPEEFIFKILKAADNYLFLRQLATVFTVNASQSLGVPALDADPSDADWTSELATGSEDSAMRFGKRELKPWPLAKRIKISNKLLQLQNISGTITAYDGSEGGQGGGIENFITGRIGYKLAVAQEQAFMTGSGVGQPLGIFIASTRGISTARDVVTGSATGFTFDGLINAVYTPKVPYQPRLKWLFSRPAVNRIRLLKDSQNRYLWMESTQVGEPAKLLNYPVVMSEYVPSTFTDQSYVGMLADFSFYWIAQMLNVQMQRLNELYAESNLVGYIARTELDGMPALEEAFVRLKCGT